MAAPKKKRRILGFMTGDIGRLLRFQNLQRQASNLKSTLSGSFRVPKFDESKTETFDQAMLRLNLDEHAIRQRAQECKRLCVVYIIFFLAVMGYVFYCFIQEQYRAALISLFVSFIPLSQFFRYHFWMTQIRQRKLGLTIKSWFRITFLGKNI